MNEEEIRASIAELRARRQSIPELRDYKPQARGKKPVVPVSTALPEDTFAGLFTEAPAEEATS